MLNLRFTLVAAASFLCSACATTAESVSAPTSNEPAASQVDIAKPVEAPEAVAVPVMPQPPAPTPSATPAATQSGNLPVSVKPGECYARVVNPPRFEPRSETVLAKAATERIEIIPARFEAVDEKVLVKPAGKKIAEIIPPVYRTVEETVIVKAASERLEQIPTIYKDVEETQLIKPATTEWKKGRGPIEKVDGLTGEIMCLVTVPAEYRTVKKRMVVSPAAVRRVAVPAEYATIQRQELVSPGSVREVETPAEYKTVRSVKMVAPAEEKRIPVAAEYQTVVSQVLVREGTAEWKSILCETNTTPGIVQDIQRALLAKRFNPGKIDGVIGQDTATAIREFQQANGLATGGLTMDTLDKLGVGPRS